MESGQLIERSDYVNIVIAQIFKAQFFIQSNGKNIILMNLQLDLIAFHFGKVYRLLR